MFESVTSPTQSPGSVSLNLAAIPSANYALAQLLPGLETAFGSSLGGSSTLTSDTLRENVKVGIQQQVTIGSDSDVLMNQFTARAPEYCGDRFSQLNQLKLKTPSSTSTPDLLTGDTPNINWVPSLGVEDSLRSNGVMNLEEIPTSWHETFTEFIENADFPDVEEAIAEDLAIQPMDIGLEPQVQELPVLALGNLRTTPSSATTFFVPESSSSLSAVNVTQHLVGTLEADTFFASPTYKYTVLSGNGNIEFGTGQRDVIDLSNINSMTVSFNLVTASGGGKLYNPGNGTRVFDAITLSDGRQILFEGIDELRFADGILNLSIVPNDPGFQSQWNLHMMGVHNAWGFTTGSASNVLIGVQDTGLVANAWGSLHPDLDVSRTYFDAGNVLDETVGTLSHGTAVQSIIAAETNNGSGLSGINWNSDVLNIDVLGGEWGDYSLAEATQTMINVAASTGRQLIINMSLGSDSGGWTGLNPDLEKLIASNQKNVLFVIAAGNENNGYLSYPANLANLYSNVIAVGASWGAQDQFGNSKEPGTRISYPWWGSNYGFGLSLMGPSEVPAFNATQTFFNTSFGYEADFNGTSAAAPNVSGVASLVWSANPNLTATQVHRILAQTAYDLGMPGYDYEYGHGFLNADAAVRRAMALNVVPDSPIGAA